MGDGCVVVAVIVVEDVRRSRMWISYCVCPGEYKMGSEEVFLLSPTFFSHPFFSMSYLYLQFGSIVIAREGLDTI